MNDAVKYNMAKGSGKTVRFPIMRPIDRVTDATSEGDNPTNGALTSDSVEVSYAKYTKAVGVSMESWNILQM